MKGKHAAQKRLSAICDRPMGVKPLRSFVASITYRNRPCTVRKRNTVT